MSETVAPDQSPSGTSLQTAGGIALAGAVLVAGWSLFSGDYITAAAVLLYVPVGLLLYRIGKHPDRL